MKELYAYKKYFLLMCTCLSNFFLSHIHIQTQVHSCHFDEKDSFLCFVWIVFIVLADTMALCLEVMNVHWVITIRPGPGPNTSTRVQLGPSTPTLVWQNSRTACPALQVKHHASFTANDHEFL